MRAKALTTQQPFNSFEDETDVRSPLLGRRDPFNSFEDETRSRLLTWCWKVTLSIPLRMKPATQRQGKPSPHTAFNSFEDETDLLLFSLLYSRG